jgi:phosphotransferase system HPr (HPr) family protein
MGVLMLGAGKDSVITVKAEGNDAKQALDALEDLVVRRKFDEE